MATLNLVPAVEGRVSLVDARRNVLLTHAVDRLVARAGAHAPLLAGIRVTVVSSTASGGGVSEMLHSLLPLMAELRISSQWLVLDVPPADAPASMDTAPPADTPAPSPASIDTAPPAPVRPEAARISTSPPTEPEPLARDNSPPTDFSGPEEPESEATLEASPARTDTLAPSADEPEPATNVTLPALPDSLAPLDTRTDPDDDADEPLDTSTSPLPL